MPTRREARDTRRVKSLRQGTRHTVLRNVAADSPWAGLGASTALQARAAGAREAGLTQLARGAAGVRALPVEAHFASPGGGEVRGRARHTALAAHARLLAPLAKVALAVLACVAGAADVAPRAALAGLGAMVAHRARDARAEVAEAAQHACVLQKLAPSGALTSSPSSQRLHRTPSSLYHPTAHMSQPLWSGFTS